MPDNTPHDPAPGDELWIGRIGISAGMEVFRDQTVAEKWLSTDKKRRIWKVTVAAAEEYVLTPPVPPRLVPKGGE
jgi:hypothetical protein